jgi:hypothetical protein
MEAVVRKQRKQKPTKWPTFYPFSLSIGQIDAVDKNKGSQFGFTLRPCFGRSTLIPWR